jgi:hypothetical protein
MSRTASRACDGRDFGKTSICPRQQAAVSLAISMWIHSILDVCSSFILKYFPHMMATLQLDETPKPQVSALRLFDLFCVDLATDLVQSIRMLRPRISANEDHQL